MNEDIVLKIVKEKYPEKQFLSYTCIRLIKIPVCERLNPSILRSALLFLTAQKDCIPSHCPCRIQAQKSLEET